MANKRVLIEAEQRQVLSGFTKSTLNALRIAMDNGVTASQLTSVLTKLSSPDTINRLKATAGGTDSMSREINS